MDAITNPQDQLSRQWFDEVRESSLVLRISRVVCSNGSVKVASRRHYAARHSRLKLIHRVCYGSSPFFSFFFSFFYLKKANRRASVPPILDDDTTPIETCVRSLTRDEIEERSQPPVGYCTVVRLWIDNIDDARYTASQRILDSLARGTECYGKWLGKDGFEEIFNLMK